MSKFCPDSVPILSRFCLNSINYIQFVSNLYLEQSWPVLTWFLCTFLLGTAFLTLSSCSPSLFYGSKAVRIASERPPKAHCVEKIETLGRRQAPISPVVIDGGLTPVKIFFRLRLQNLFPCVCPPSVVKGKRLAVVLCCACLRGFNCVVHV